MIRNILRRGFSLPLTNIECYNLSKRFDTPIYNQPKIAIERGEGVYLWDVEGNRYIDINAASTAVNHGHCHPKVRTAILEQAKKLTLTSRAFYNSRLGPYEEMLTSYLGYDKVCLMNSGTEALDTAVKFARRWAYNVKGIEDNQARCLFAKEGYWGRSIAGGASSDSPERYENFGPMKGFGFDLVEYNNAPAVEAIFKKNSNYAAIILEPIQGDAGIVIPDKGYLKQIRAICDKYNVLLILDEIQTGTGRTGKFACYEYEGIKPDILTLGKSLGAGFYPISACLANDEIMMQIKPGEHGSTFGGNPLACAAGEAAFKVLFEEDLIENSRLMGAYLREELTSALKDVPVVKEVRGVGMLNGVE